MTREEAIEMWVIPALKNTWNEKRCNEVLEALEQESCENCISRQAVLEQTYNWSKDEFLRVTNPFDYLHKRINSLPSVTPAEKVAHWEYVQYDGNPNIGNWHCSKCRAIVNYEPIYSWEKKPSHKFCSNCGAKMEAQDANSD